MALVPGNKNFARKRSVHLCSLFYQRFGPEHYGLNVQEFDYFGQGDELLKHRRIDDNEKDCGCMFRILADPDNIS